MLRNREGEGWLATMLQGLAEPPKRYLVNKGILREVFGLLVEAEVEVGGGQDVRQRSEAMEQHGRELDDQDEGEEEDKHQSDGLQLQVLLADVDLQCVRFGCEWGRLRCCRYGLFSGWLVW